MTLHLLSFKSPETKMFEKQIDANEKLNTIKHIKLENEFNEIQNEFNELENKIDSFKSQNIVHQDKKIYDYFNERLKAQNYENLELNQIQFTSDSGNVILNSKFIFDIQEQLSNHSSQLENIKQDYKLNLDKQRKEIIDQVINFIQNHTYETLKVENLKFKSPIHGQPGMILNGSEIHNIINALEQNKIDTIKNVIQLLYNKGLFDNFPNKDQVFEQYLTFSDQYLKEKYTSEINTSDGLYYLSDLNYSQSRKNIIKALKKDKNTDIVYLRHHLKLTPQEINFILFSE